MTKSTDAAATKREALRHKVASSQAALARPRLPESNPPDGMRSLAMDYPFALVLGGLAIGLIAGAFIPRAAGRKLGKGAVAAATIASELALTYGQRALEEAGKAADESRARLSDLGTSVSDGVSSYGSKAADALGDAGKAVSDAARDTAGSARDGTRRLARKAMNLASHLRH